jgi:hypothetical protein
MKNGNFKNALLGTILACIAAYLYFAGFILIVERWRWSPRMLFLFPFVVLFYVSWIVIPLGASLGMLIPRMAYGKARWVAALQGAALGGVAGLISILCLMSAYQQRSGEPFIVASIIAYCALWVGGYAFFRAKGQSLYR